MAGWDGLDWIWLDGIGQGQTGVDWTGLGCTGWDGLAGTGLG